MAGASYAVPSFLGGEISQFAQGRFDRPDYRMSLSVCFNGLPLEIGAWTRRPGTMDAGHTRGGAAGRVIKFDFEQSNAVTLELTDGRLRARSGAMLLGTNDDQAVVSVQNTTPAIIHLAKAVPWATGDTLIFLGAGPSPVLENRQFIASRIDATDFALTDALTGQPVDGSTLGTITTGAIVRRIQELVTVYAGGAWSNIRAVQAETTDILLSGSFAPQALVVSTLPSADIGPVFAIQPATFNDGPYLDPFTSGVRVTPSALSGVINLTLSFAPFSSTTAYAKGSFVTSAGVDFVSLIDQNVGNAPSVSQAAWASTPAATAINEGRGFLGSDTGRLVRLFSEPPLWDIASPFTAGNIVTYNPSGEPGAATYWQSLVDSTGKAPGSDLTNWKVIPQGAALWTWGRITGFSNIVDRALGTAFGNMTLFNGITAPFDGNFSKVTSSSAGLASSGGFVVPNQVLGVSGFVGKNFSATPQRIKQVTVYPPTDLGFGFASLDGSRVTPFFTINLRAAQVAPSSSTDGALLGTVSFSGSSPNISLTSSDQATAWGYVWVELILIITVPATHPANSFALNVEIAQISFFNPTSSASLSSGCSVEILGPALLYGSSIVTWRLGVYSDTTGWPTCGCYDDGRLWLGGAVSNRFDASTSNGIVPGSAVVNFAPTDQYGVVAASNAISETINADSVNPLFWMVPDLQGILIGTQAGEFLILAPTSGSIAPNNITSRRATRIGSANVEPRRTDHTLLFVKRYGRKLMEYFADVFSGKFSAPNLADRAQHIPRSGIAELAYTDAVTPLAWGRNNDGSWFGITYKRDALTTSQGPTYAGWHRQELGSGRIVESICSGPSVGGDLDSLTMVTNDPATNIRRVEVLTDTPDELTALADSWFLDGAVTPTSTSSSNEAVAGAPYGGLTLNGLWHLNGKTVQIFAGGLDCGFVGDNNQSFSDFTVTNGSVLVPYGDGVAAGTGGGQFTAAFAAALAPSQIVAGFTFTSKGQLVRPVAQADTGARNGPAFGKLRRNHRMAAQVVNTLGLWFGTTFDKLVPAPFRQANQKALPPLTMYSGIVELPPFDDYSYDGQLCWQITRPFPATIVAIGGNIETMDQ